MADPLTVLGGLASVGQIVGAIVKTVHDLAELRNKFKDAAPTVGLLISELTAIKGALVQIDDWAKYNFEDTPLQEDLRNAFEVSLEGCNTAMEALSIEVSDVLGKDSVVFGVTLRFQARYAWNESSMKDHQQRLHTQIGAMQLLLQAVHIRTLPGQAALLRDPKTKKLMQKIKDDTSSIRASVSTRAGSVSSASRPVSTIGSTVFDGIDEQLMLTGPYTNHGAQVQARHASRNDLHEEEPRPPQRTPSQSSSITSATTTTTSSTALTTLTREDTQSTLTSPLTRESTQTTATSASSGPARKSPPVIKRKQLPRHTRAVSAGAAQLPQIRIPPKQPHIRQPYESTVPSEPLPPRRSYTPSETSSGGSDSLSPIQNGIASLFRNKTDPTVSIFSALRSKKSRASFSGTSQERLSPNSLGSGIRRRRSRENEDPYTSVQFPTRESAQKCPLVQAAQSGSSIEVEDLLDRGANVEQIHAPTKRTALAVAAHCGHDDVVTLLILKRARLNTRDLENRTPLHLASSRGHYRAVERLLREGADLDVKDSHDKCPLRLASEAGYHEVVGLLLRHHARVNSRDLEQRTPLHAAAKMGDDAIVQMLVNAGADPQARDSNLMTALHYAAENDHCLVIDLLYGKKTIDMPGKANMTPLSCACAAGSTSATRLLLKKNASTKAKGDGDMTALHWASYHGHSDVVDMLLESKASTTCKTQDGRTPLHLAAMSRNFSTAELLVRRKAPVDVPCGAMMRPLHYAIESSAMDIVRLLVSSRANLEAESNPLKWRPMHLAVTTGHSEIVSFLVASGAAFDARDVSGDRPLCLASAAGHADIVTILLDAGAETSQHYFADRHDSQKDSPLCLAARNGHVEVAAALLNRGAHPTERDERNWQPLRYAAYFAHPGVVQLLLDRGASITALGASGGWGFEMTASRIGFSPDADIDEVRRAHVLNLLQDAEMREREMQSYQQQIHTQAAPPPMKQSEAVEIDNRPYLSAEDDRRSNGPGFQLPPRAELRAPGGINRVPVREKAPSNDLGHPPPPKFPPYGPPPTSTNHVLPSSWLPTPPVSFAGPPSVSSRPSDLTYSSPAQQPYPSSSPALHPDVLPPSSTAAGSRYTPPSPPSQPSQPYQQYKPPKPTDLESMICFKCHADGLTMPDLARCIECRDNFYRTGNWTSGQKDVAGTMASQEIVELPDTSVHR